MADCEAAGLLIWQETAIHMLSRAVVFCCFSMCRISSTGSRLELQGDSGQRIFVHRLPSTKFRLWKAWGVRQEKICRSV